MQSSRSPAVQPLSLGPLHHLALNHALESVPQRSMKRTMKSPQKRPKSRFCAYAIMATFLHSTRHNQVGSPEKSLEYGHICGAKRTCDELSVLLVSGAVPRDLREMANIAGKRLLSGTAISPAARHRTPLSALHGVKPGA